MQHGVERSEGGGDMQTNDNKYYEDGVGVGDGEGGEESEGQAASLSAIHSRVKNSRKGRRGEERERDYGLRVSGIEGYGIPNGCWDANT